MHIIIKSAIVVAHDYRIDMTEAAKIAKVATTNPLRMYISGVV